MSFALKSACIGKMPRKKIDTSQVLYEVGAQDIQIDNPFDNDAEFCVSL
jgi:hypothetical protein